MRLRRRTPGPSERVRFGVLAPSSRIARAAVVPAMEASEHAEVVASASMSAGQDYGSVLEHPDVEAVYLPLPNGLHREWAERCAAAGKHVLCEKPLALDPGDVRAMADTCDRAGVVLMEAYMTPFHPRSAALVDLVAGGRLGRPVSARATFTFPLSDPTDHRWDPTLGGGALADVGIYVLTQLLDIARAAGSDDPEHVTAHSVETGLGVDVTTVGLMRFRGGLSTAFECSFDAPPRQVVEVVGTGARVSVERCFTPDESDTDLVLHRRDGSLHTVRGTGVNPYRAMVDHFCAVVRGRSRLQRTPAMSVTLAELCERIRSGP